MRDGSGSSSRPSQGLTQFPLRFAKKRLKDLEVTERRQVGDAESMVNQGDSGALGFYNRDGEM
jgi:hypothetical protein